MKAIVAWHGRSAVFKLPILAHIVGEPSSQLTTDSTYPLPLLPFTPLTAAGLTGYGPPSLGLEIETPNHEGHNLLDRQL